MDYVLHFSVRTNLINYINQNYVQKTACFINLVMFNVKSNEGWTLYNQMIDLSIVYLIVISGFHLSFLKRLIYKILGKYKKTSYSISLGLIFTYLYFLNFATSALRVFISMMVSSLLKRKVKSRLDILGISGLITITIEPSCAYSIGFGLSYLCTFAIIIVYGINIQNFFLEKVLVNLVATLVGLPFVLSINGFISL
jgi:competence protein ComEC